MNKFHRILSAVLVFLLCFSLTPVSVLADEIAEPEWQEVISATQSVIDAVDAAEEEVSPEEPPEPEAAETLETTTCATIAEAGAVLCAGMTERRQIINVELK